jgi:Tellurite resistance protein TerB
MSLQKLSREDRQRLMRFVCSFAWADLEVKKTERALVQKMAKKLALDDDELAMVKEWLKVPPRAEDVDPQSIPSAQRKLFLEAAREMIAVDGEVDPEEKESFQIFEQLLRG